MRWLVRVLVVGVPLAVAYLAWPALTALEIGEAIAAGDSATLERAVDWPALRASIKTSLSPEAASRLAADPAAPKPTLWQRIKAVAAPGMADGVVERYVTPENLPMLLGARAAANDATGARPHRDGPTTVLAGTLLAGTGIDRLASFWRQVRRAVFYPPSRFEIEAEDSLRPGRRYVGTLELKGWRWKLTGLAIAGGSF